MIEKRMFEKMLMDEDIRGCFLNIGTKGLEELIDPAVARMKDFDQKNCHHCYDLLEHTLQTVAGIQKEDFCTQDFLELRIAALFHDIGKPTVAFWDNKRGQQRFFGHAEESAKIAEPILRRMGYSNEEIERILFYIIHHDDFMNFRLTLTPEERKNKCFTEITAETVANLLLKHQNAGIIMNLQIYQNLLQLCKADNNAQAEYAVLNGKIKGSKEEKIARIMGVEKELETAWEIYEMKTKSNITI